MMQKERKYDIYKEEDINDIYIDGHQLCVKRHLCERNRINDPVLLIDNQNKIKTCIEKKYIKDNAEKIDEIIL